MIIFMDLVLHTPPSWLSMPSMVPLDVAADREREREKGGAGLELAVADSIWCRVLERIVLPSLPEVYLRKKGQQRQLKGFC